MATVPTHRAAAAARVKVTTVSIINSAVAVTVVMVTAPTNHAAILTATIVQTAVSAVAVTAAMVTAPIIHAKNLARIGAIARAVAAAMVTAPQVVHSTRGPQKEVRLLL
jgi:hypothetical protein